MQSVITLLTDFGLYDGYVAAMKGVIYDECRDYKENLIIVDITHNIPQGDIKEAGYILSEVYPYFPIDTLHLVIVDPGVGSSRAILYAECKRGRFMLPDNGILSFLHQEDLSNLKVWELPLPKISRDISNTFHGRDIFAPWAAAIALDQVVKLIIKTDWKRLEIPQPVRKDKLIEGEIIRIDHFGNLISNIPKIWFDDLDLKRIHGRIKDKEFSEIYPFYMSAPDKNLFALFGSHGCLELAMNQRNAALESGLKRGDKLSINIECEVD